MQPIPVKNRNKTTVTVTRCCIIGPRLISTIHKAYSLYSPEPTQYTANNLHELEIEFFSSQKKKKKKNLKKRRKGKWEQRQLLVTEQRK